MNAFFGVNLDFSGKLIISEIAIEDHILNARVPRCAFHRKRKRSVFFRRHCRIEAPLSLEARVARFRQEPRVKLVVKLCHIE